MAKSLMKSSVAVSHSDPEWKGYDMEELRYRRAYVMARMEIEKERMSSSARSLYSSTAGQASSGIMGKLLGSLSYIDYGVLAFRLGKRVFSLFRSLRR